ncbi:MAG: energy-coupling factor transporter transmembrane component T [Pseudomonadota bacterium]
MISLTSPLETRAHGWPAGAKLAALCAATVVLFVAEALIWHLGFLTLMLTAYALPGPRFLKSGLARLLVLWPFVALILVWHVFTHSTTQGAVIVLRLITAVGLANLVTMTTRLSDMMAVVRKLTAPLRRLGINTRAIEIALAMVIRFTPVLGQKGVLLAQSWRARARRRVGWRIVVPLTVLAIDDAEHVAEALKARGGVASGAHRDG